MKRDPSIATARDRLEFFPVAFFTVIIGLSGFTLAWQKIEQVLDFPPYPRYLLTLLTIVFFLLLLFIYAIKWLHYRTAVKSEWQHPVQLSFFPAISISLILLGTLLLSTHHEIALALWLTGSSLHLLLTLAVLNIWLNQTKFEIIHMNPAWFIPIVGNIVIPIAGVQLRQMEMSWFFFSIGIVFWPLLQTIVFNRIIFHTPLPENLLPTQAILIAPPAVGFLSYTALTGHLDTFAYILYYFALFLCLLLFTQVKRLSRLDFTLAWWAYSFPIAAFTVASLEMYTYTQQHIFKTIGLISLVLLNGLIVLLIFKTLQAIRQHKICQPG